MALAICAQSYYKARKTPKKNAEFSLHLERENRFCAPWRGENGAFSRPLEDGIGAKVALSEPGCGAFEGQKCHSRQAKVLQSVGKSGTFAPAPHPSRDRKSRNHHKTSTVAKLLQNRVFRTNSQKFLAEALVEADFLVKFS